MVTGGLLALSWASLKPLPVRPDTAPPDAFSAARALHMLQQVLGPEHPHPIGSAENARVRERLIEGLRELGYSPTEQPATTCSSDGVCGPVVNVTATLPGSTDRHVMLACHYDSVPAGPGAADDGAGIAAIMEIARALREAPPRQRGVVFFFGDGEEAGLLGARAFAEHPLADSVDVVINLEARGSRGPVAMFETSPDNGNLIAAFGRAAPRPFATSLLYGLYRLLPNDTDLTVFKQQGLQGLNLAFADGLADYHTPGDNLSRLDPSSVQHLGETALLLTRALREGDLSRRSDASYFDVLGRLLVRWPGWFTYPLVLVAVALSGLTIRGVAGARLAWGVAGVLGGLLTAGLATAAAGWVVTFAASTDRPWWGVPLPWEIGFSGCGLAALLWIVRAVIPRATPRGWTAALAAVGLLGCLVTTLLAPTVAYVFLIPTLAIGVAAQLRSVALGTVIGLVGTALSWLPLVQTIRIMIGLEAPAVFVLPLMTALLPMVTGFGMTGLRLLRDASALVGFVALAIGLGQPAQTARNPRPLNVVHFEEQAEARTVLWTRSSAPVPRALEATGRFSLQDVPLRPWSRRLYWSRPGELLQLSPPEIANPRWEDRRIAGSLRSPRGGRELLLAFPDRFEVRRARLAGRDVGPNSDRASNYHPGWTAYAYRGLQAGDSVELDLEFEEEAPRELVLMDLSEGLPSHLEPLLRARPTGWVPIQTGDVTIVRTVVERPDPPAASEP